MEDGTFCAGALLGFIMAGIIGLILDRIREARGRAGAQERTLDRFPAAVQPTLTPAGIVRASWEARWAVVAWTLVLIIVVALSFLGAYYFTLPG